MTDMEKCKAIIKDELSLVSNYWNLIPYNGEEVPIMLTMQALFAKSFSDLDAALNSLSTHFRNAENTSSTSREMKLMWASDMVRGFALELEQRHGIRTPVMDLYKTEYILSRPDRLGELVDKIGLTNGYWHKVQSSQDEVATMLMGNALRATTSEQKNAAVQSLSNCFSLYIGKETRMMWASDMVGEFAFTLENQHCLRTRVMDVLKAERASEPNTNQVITANESHAAAAGASSRVTTLARC